MAEYICDRCGEVNPVGTVFCISCHAFLAWDQVERDDRPEVEAAIDNPGAPTSATEQNVETRMVPRIRVPATASEAKPAAGFPSPQRVPTDTTEGLFRIAAEQREVVVPPTGEPAVLTLRVMNTSAIVDGYVVESPDAPHWLQVEPAQLRLLPGSEEVLLARMRVSSTTLVPAQQLHVTLRIRSLSQAPAQAELPVQVTVPAIDTRAVLDNRNGAQGLRVTMRGDDPENVARFVFTADSVEIRPARWPRRR